MCGLKKLASGVFLGSWKVLAERWRWRWRRQRRQNGGGGGGDGSAGRNGPKTTRTTRTPAFWDIPSQNKTKSKLQSLQNCQKFKFLKFCNEIYTGHILKLLDKMYKYELDPTRTVGITERTWDAGQTDGQSETNNFVVYNHLSILRLKLNHVSKRGPRIFAPAMAPGWLILLQLNGMLINSLWPGDILWQQRSGSALAQVMACCLTAPSHYLNQCWLIVSKVLWHSSEGNFTKNASATNHWN